jgi:hypothetical protein
MNRYLLLAGDDYYPLHGDGDWVDFYATREQAEAEITPVIVGGGRKKYIVSGSKGPLDWYEIIDTETWTPQARQGRGY